MQTSQKELAYLKTKWIQDGETIVSVSKPGGNMCVRIETAARSYY
jgi:hypothetical protein